MWLRFEGRTLAAQAIAAGDEIIVAGGMESMSRAPYLLNKARWGYRLGNDEVVDSMLSEGLTCAMAGCHMGVTAENVRKSTASHVRPRMHLPPKARAEPKPQSAADASMKKSLP